MSKLLISITFLFILSFCVGQTANDFVPIFMESKETTHKIPEGQTYIFGYLGVPEN